MKQHIYVVSIYNCVALEIIYQAHFLVVVNQTKIERPLECLQTQTGEDYRGTVKVTIDGVPCQRWDSLHPH